MKRIFVTAIVFFVSVWSHLAQAESEEQIAARYAEAIEYAARYSLTEMRPTANFRGATIERVRPSDQNEGGDIKARVSTSWVTAFTGKNRTTVIDVWISGRADGVYLTRYKLYADDHNVPIANQQEGCACASENRRRK